MTAVDDVVHLDVSAVQYSVEQRRVVKHVDIVVPTCEKECHIDRSIDATASRISDGVWLRPLWEPCQPTGQFFQSSACNPMNPTYLEILEPHLAGVAEQCLRYLDAADIVPRTT